MKRFLLIVCATCVIALLASAVQAKPQWTREQLEVWNVISKVWDMEMKDDQSWTDMLHPSYQSWPYETPAPLDKEGTLRFIKAERGHFKILAQHLVPVAIIVVGDTAVVHFFHTTVTEWNDGERETTDGRGTDVLTRTSDGWRIVSWVGDELGEDDD